MTGLVPLLSLLLLAPPAPEAGAGAPDILRNLHYMSEVSPPDNFVDKSGRATGFFVDVLELVWKELGVPSQEIEFLPWARAYERLQDTPGTVLFGTIRLPEREKLFRWVGPVRTVRVILFGKKGRGTPIAEVSPAALQGRRVGTVISDAGEKLMVERGFDLKQLDRATSARALMLKLVNDRIDLVAYGESGALDFMREGGMRFEDFEVFSVLSKPQLYFALHRGTPDEAVARFQSALDTVMRRPGALPPIFEKYGIPVERRAAP